MLAQEYREVIKVLFNRKSSKDMEMVAFLKSKGNVSGYIKELITKEMEETR